jgi:hypothetical protein
MDSACCKHVTLAACRGGILWQTGFGNGYRFPIRNFGKPIDIDDEVLSVH